MRIGPRARRACAPVAREQRVSQACAARLLGMALALVLLAGPSAAQGRIDPEVAAAAARGPVRVVVQLAEPVAGDAALATRARQTQRARIRARRMALESELADLPLRELRVARRLRSRPFVALEVTNRSLARLARSPHVAHVVLDRLASPSLADSVPQIEGDESHELGLRGAGQVIAILDTGIDEGHPALAGKVVGEACFASGSPIGSGSCPNGLPSQEGPGAGAACDYGSGCAHGTAVAGIAAGAAVQVPLSPPGIAPEADLLSIQIYSRFSGSSCGGTGIECPLSWSSDQAAALEHVYDVMRFEHDIAVVNMSLAAGAFTSEASCDAGNALMKSTVDDLLAVGIAVVGAAGNAGEPAAVGAPACLTQAVGVGAVTQSDAIAGYSNRAPFLEFYAPGSSVRAPLAGTSTVRSHTGTSYAAPHVAGAIALMREAAPDASMADLITLLAWTGLPLPDATSSTVRPRVRTALAQVLGPCGDGLDNDGDGVANYPADPGCASAFSPTESPACDDGLDNDADGMIDALGRDLDGDGAYDGVGEAPPDPGCAGIPSRDEETPPGVACGLGFEIALVLVPLLRQARRRR